MQAMINKNSSKQNNIEMPAWQAALLSIVSMIIVYVIFMQLWILTSSKYLPSEDFDFSVKTPAYKEQWFVRRENSQ